MGELIDSIKNAAAGTPYKGNGTNIQITDGNTKPIVGKPITLNHSLDSQEVLGKPMMLNEGTGEE